MKSKLRNIAFDVVIVVFIIVVIKASLDVTPASKNWSSFACRLSLYVQQQNVNW